MRDSRSKPCRRNSSEVRDPNRSCTCQEEKKVEESGKRSKREEQPAAKWVHRHQVGAMKGGAGNFNSPRKEPYNRDTSLSRSLRRQQQSMQEDEVL